MRALYLRLRTTAPAAEGDGAAPETAGLVRTLAEGLESLGAVARTGGGSDLEVVYPYEDSNDGDSADGWQERALTEVLFWLRGRIAMRPSI